MSEFLITPSLGMVSVTSAAEARAARDSLLEESKSVVLVRDRLDADDATTVLRNLKAYAKTIEAARKQAKEQPMELGRKIDALAKDLTTEIEREAGRIGAVLGAYELQERQKAEDARRAADNEAARIQREAWVKAEAARRAAPDSLAADRASDAVVEKAAEQIVAVKQAAANAVAPKQSGTAIRTDYQFEVLDIRALYAAHPELVTLEPNGSAIRAILRANPNLQIPGLRSWAETKLNVR